MARPVTFAVAIIIVVLLPLLSLQGVEGKMFRPMALVVALAMTGALLLTLTYVPAAATLFLRGRVSETEPWLMRRAWALLCLIGAPTPFRSRRLGGFLVAAVLVS